MSRFFEELNSTQIEAVSSTEGYIRVIAGPGSGKTRTIVNRYGYLIENCGITSSHILCVTFTNKAANVMKERLKKFFGSNFSGMIYTFHGLCAKILRKDIYRINFPETFNIIDDNDKENIYKNIYEKLSLEKSNMKYKEMDDCIYFYKRNNLVEYIEYLTDLTNEKQLNCENYIAEYLNTQRKNYALDFNDLILMCLYIFAKYDDVLIKYQNMFQYIMIDEFQDINNLEFQLATLFSEKHKNLFVVGDPDQQIYSWRGAQNYITHFDEIFPSCKTIILNVNYRSTPEIINVSNDVIRYNSDRIEKEMETYNQHGKMPVFYHAKNQFDEADWICHNINKLVEEKNSLNDIAIIYRMNRNSKFLEDAFVKNNIPYRIYGNVGFYERKEIKDIISYLRFLVNHDDLSFERIINCPTRQIGKKKLEFLYGKQYINGKSLYANALEYSNNPIFKNCKLKEFLELIKQCEEKIEKESVSDLLNFIYKNSGYEKMIIKESNDDRLENINELFDALKNVETSYGEKLTLQDYLEMVSLDYNNQDNGKDDKINLMTAHLSKGTEYKFVFVCSLSESIFPISRAITQNAMEEERRLCYVAFTRAENQLFLSDSEGFNYATSSSITPSRFIFEINQNNITLEGIKFSPDEINNIKKSFHYEKKFDHYVNNSDVGKRVKHVNFGLGTVVGINSNENSYIIKFDNCLSERNINALNKDLVLYPKDDKYTKKSLQTIEKAVQNYNNNSNVDDNLDLPLNNFLSVNDIMTKYNLTRYRVMKIIHSGNVKVYKSGNKYMINQNDLDQYFAKIKRESLIILLLLFGFIIAILIIYALYL